MDKYILVKGAREHNLKNITVKIPREKLVVVTGLSGSGKSSLAFDTVFMEAQRRYLQSLSAYARQFLGDLQKPDVDNIEGISPSIAIEQKAVSRNPRSIVATVTEIYDYLRLLFANIGIPHCPKCGRKIEPKTSQEIINEVLSKLENGTKFKILSPVVRGKKGRYDKLLKKLKKEGFMRVVIKDEGHEEIEYLLDEDIELDKNRKHTIEVVVDRLIFRGNNPDFVSRLTDAVETALRLSEGMVKIKILGGDEYFYSEYNFCDNCGISYEKLLPRNFSFNTPYGACPVCKGLGFVEVFDPNKLFPDRSIPILEADSIRLLGRRNGIIGSIISGICASYGISDDVPMKDYPEDLWNDLLYGTDITIEPDGDWDFYGSDRIGTHFIGILNILKDRYFQTKSDDIRDYYRKYMTERPCPECGGKRLKPEVLAVTIDGKNIWDICEMTVEDALKWFKGLKLGEREAVIVRDVMKEIISRYTFLENVGLEYITLDRQAKTLSGGESERIRLATQIGSNLVGVLYVLDEPTIGLHPRDKLKLIRMLKELSRRGNTVLVVEHDEDMILNADYIVDMGPGAGTHGGRVVATGTPEEIKRHPDSITGKYLSGRLRIPVPTKRRKPSDKWLALYGARAHNLKNIDVKIPIGLFVCITGVSGAGKSTLVQEVLINAVNDALSGNIPEIRYYDRLEGAEYIDRVINVDQSPIGRTPKSVPCTYTKAFDYIREIFASTEDAKIRGYTKSRFSFNLRGGRCEKCKGLGYNLIEMHFLPDVYVRCDVCKGKRYNAETLEVKYKGKSIHDVLMMTHAEALEFFSNHSRLRGILKTVCDVGLGYLTLGQASNTLSGGESQRLKLSRELSKVRDSGRTLYILDEPTTGLHTHDIKMLIDVLQRLVDRGNTVVVIEHNLDVIKCADYIIDLGPEGGSKGGEVVAVGTPEEIAAAEGSYTGKYLSKILKRDGISLN